MSNLYSPHTLKFIYETRVQRLTEDLASNPVVIAHQKKIKADAEAVIVRWYAARNEWATQMLKTQAAYAQVLEVLRRIQQHKAPTPDRKRSKSYGLKLEALNGIYEDRLEVFDDHFTTLRRLRRDFNTNQTAWTSELEVLVYKNLTLVLKDMACALSSITTHLGPDLVERKRKEEPDYAKWLARYMPSFGNRMRMHTVHFGHFGTYQNDPHPPMPYLYDVFDIDPPALIPYPDEPTFYRMREDADAGKPKTWSYE